METLEDDTVLKEQFIKLLTRIYKGHKEYDHILAAFKQPNIYVTPKNASVYLYLWIDPKLLKPELEADFKEFDRLAFAHKRLRPHK